MDGNSHWDHAGGNEKMVWQRNNFCDFRAHAGDSSHNSKRIFPSLVERTAKLSHERQSMMKLSTSVPSQSRPYIHRVTPKTAFAGIWRMGRKRWSSLGTLYSSEARHGYPPFVLQLTGACRLWTILRRYPGRNAQSPERDPSCSAE